MKLTDLRENSKHYSVADFLADERKKFDDYHDGDNFDKAYDFSNHEITSWVGCPTRVDGHLNMSDNQLTNFTRAPVEIKGYLMISGNPITSLKDIHKHVHMIDYTLYLDYEKIKSHVLGVLMIDKLKMIDGLEGKNDKKYPWATIVNTYLMRKYNGEPVKDLLYECQEALIHADFPEHAHL